jgi:Ribosomal protein S9
MAAEVHYGTGRRKRSVARVFIKRGKGKIQVNKKSLDEFFVRETARMIVKHPLDPPALLDPLKIVATVKGGGGSAHYGAIRHGLSRTNLSYEDNLRSA